MQEGINSYPFAKLFYFSERPFLVTQTFAASSSLDCSSVSPSNRQRPFWVLSVLIFLLSETRLNRQALEQMYIIMYVHYIWHMRAVEINKIQ